MNINKLTNYTAGVAQIWMDKGPLSGFGAPERILKLDWIQVRYALIAEPAVVKISKIETSAKSLKHHPSFLFW